MIKGERKTSTIKRLKNFFYIIKKHIYFSETMDALQKILPTNHFFENNSNKEIKIIETILLVLNSGDELEPVYKLWKAPVKKTPY